MTRGTRSAGALRRTARARRCLGPALALLAFACGGPASEAPPHVLLVTVDTLRPDYLSANGYDRPSSPEIDALLAEGFYFEQAVAPVARTTPALASLLTGAYPHTTGVRTLTDSLRADVATLTEALEASGYQTLAVVTNQVLTRQRGLDRGFVVYDVASDTRNAAATTDAAIRQFEVLRPEQPVFAWIHYIDPHTPYHSDPELARQFDPDYRGRYQLQFGSNGVPGTNEGHRTFPDDLPKRVATHHNPLPEAVNAHIRRLYAADIRALDTQVGRLLAAARERFGANLLVVFTADHGESLGEHDFYFDHGDYVYSAGTRVPLGFVLPPAHPLHGAGRCSGWVSLVDVAPTLLELIGRELPRGAAAQIEGRSLTDCMKRGEVAPRPVFAESGHAYFFEDVKRRRRNDVAGRLRAAVQGDWKLIWTPFAAADEAWELYDLANDPHETVNLYRPDHPMFLALRPTLRRWAARSVGDAATAPPSAEDARALRELGYVE